MFKAISGRTGGERQSRYSWAAALVIIAVLPLVVRDAYMAHVLIVATMFAVLAMYWDLLDGIIGLIHFGYAAFFGIGAYTSAILCTELGLPVPAGLAVAAVAGAAIGVLIILPCLNMGIFSVAIVTLAFGEIIRIAVKAWPSLTRGEMGFWGIPPLFATPSKLPYFYAALALLAVGAWCLQRLMASRFGLAFQAVRDDELAAASSGINVKACKLLAVAISCGAAGLVGGLYAHYILTISPAICGIGYTIQIMAMSLIGGKGTLYGPLLGAYVLTLLGESLRFLEDYRLLIYGVLLITVVMFFSQGLMGVVRLLARAVRRGGGAVDARGQ